MRTFKTFYRSKNLLSQKEGDSSALVLDPHHAGLEYNVLKLISLARENIIPATGEVIQTKARMLREKYKIPERTFKAIGGWLKRFLGRAVIKSSRCHGEAGKVDPASVHDEMIAFCTVLSKYEPTHIYNQYERGLVYQLLPNISYLAPE